MMSERFMFLDLKPHEGGATFGGISKGNISSIGKISTPSLGSMDVLYVEDL